MNFIYKERLVSLVLLLTISAGAYAVKFPDKPEPQHYYVDGAGLIDEVTGSEIDSLASRLLQEERIPLYVVTIPSLASHDATNGIEAYTRKLFDHWGIGWQERNYGMLLLISRMDRKVRIELGADWGGRYDHQAKRIMDQLIVPAFKRGDYASGISDGAKGLDAMARGLALPKPAKPAWFWPGAIAAALMLVLIIINLFRTGRSGWAWALIIAVGALIVIVFRIASVVSGSGSSGGFGGGSGGGSGGGGGATGSW